MNGVKKSMITLYKPLDYDWMNYKLEKEEEVTYHHIVKRSDKGPTTIENGALISKVGHRYLHIIEYKEPAIYEVINKVFKKINDHSSAPTDEERKLIEFLLQTFEYEHIDDLTSKGTPLIKEKYLKRKKF